MNPDSKQIVNTLYHGAIVSGLAAGYAKLGKMVFGGTAPKIDITSPKELGMAVIDITLALVTQDFLIKQGIIPPNIQQ